MERWRWDTNM